MAEAKPDQAAQPAPPAVEVTVAPGAKVYTSPGHMPWTSGMTLHLPHDHVDAHVKAGAVARVEQKAVEPATAGEAAAEPAAEHTATAEPVAHA